MTMNFVEVKRDREFVKANVRNIVRTSFHQYGNRKTGKMLGHTLTLYLGKDIAERLNIQHNDRIKFYTEESNNKVWFIKKSVNDSGYKVLDVKQADGSTTGAFRITLTWKTFVPSQEESNLQKVRFDYYQDGLRLFFLGQD